MTSPPVCRGENVCDFCVFQKESISPIPDGCNCPANLLLDATEGEATRTSQTLNALRNTALWIVFARIITNPRAAARVPPIIIDASCFSENRIRFCSRCQVGEDLKSQTSPARLRISNKSHWSCLVHEVIMQFSGQRILHLQCFEHPECCRLRRATADRPCPGRSTS